MTTPNIEELIAKLKTAGGDGDAIYCWNMCMQAAEAMQSQAERITAQDSEIAELKEMVRRGVINFDEVEDERDTLRAKLAALQSDDELPELPTFGDANTYTVDCTHCEDGRIEHYRPEDSEMEYQQCGHCSGHGYKLYFTSHGMQDYARQAQSMVRAKMVPLEKAAERYRWLREQIYIDEDKRLRITRTYLIADQGKTFKEQLDAAIDAAMGITGEPK